MIDLIFKNILELGKHKFASNVVEVCYQYANDQQRQKLIEYLLKDQNDNTYKYHAPRNDNGIILPYSSNLASLIFDYFGNFVIQKILDLSNSRQQSQLIEKIKPMVYDLNKQEFGKHIIFKMDSISQYSSAE